MIASVTLQTELSDDMWHAGSSRQGQVLHSVNLDFNFRLSCLQNADSRLLHEVGEEAAIGKPLTDDVEAFKFLGLAEELVEPEPAEKTCSVFTAVQVIHPSSEELNLIILMRQHLVFAS